MDQLVLDLPPKAKKSDNLYGGISAGTLVTKSNDIDNKMSKIATIRGEIASDFKQIEEAGGNKRMFKVACKIDDAPDDQTRDDLQALVDYLWALGTFERIGMALRISVPDETQKVSTKPAEPKETNQATAIIEAQAKSKSASAAAH